MVVSSHHNFVWGQPAQRKQAHWWQDTITAVHAEGTGRTVRFFVSPLARVKWHFLFLKN